MCMVHNGVVDNTECAVLNFNWSPNIIQNLKLAYMCCNVDDLESTDLN